MSGIVPVPALAAGLRLDAAALNPLWRDAATSQEPQALAQAPGTPDAAMAALAQPVRLSDLHLDPTQFGIDGWPQGRESPHEPDEDAGEEAGPSARVDPRRDGQDADWRAGLARRWQQARTPAVQQALALAREQWTAGRRVLLACPAGPVARSAHAAPGWGALLLGGERGGRLWLDGTRWPLRLQWRQRPEAALWLRARAVKQAQAGLAWQLSPAPEAGEARAAVALQLGPVLETQRRWQQLGLRIEAARPFREALGAQWSLWLLATLDDWMDGHEDAPDEGGRDAAAHA